MSLQELQTLGGHDDRVWSLAWSPKGDLLATSSSDKKIIIWGQGANGLLESKAVLTDKHKRTVRNLAWHPNGRLLASASFDGTICIWQMNQSGGFEFLDQLEGHENEVKSVAWSSDGQYLASCSRDKTIWIREMSEDNEYECVAVASGHTQDVKYVKWHPTKNILYSASYDDTIKCWKYENSVDDWMCAYTMEGHDSTVWQLDLDRTGDYLVSCGEDKNWMIWEISDQTFENKGMISGLHSRSIYSCTWAKGKIQSATGEPTYIDLIATAGADNKIMVYEINRESLANQGSSSFEFNIVAQKLMAHNNDVNCVQFHPKNAQILASCSDDGKVKIWKVELNQDQEQAQEMEGVIQNNQ